VNQIVSAKIYRAGASTDTGTIQTALDNWMGAEQVWLDIRNQDAQINSGQNARPWAGMPSYTAYPVILNYQPTGGQLPPPGGMAPTAKTASDYYLAYKDLQRNIDIVAGNNTFSFENTGALRVPGVITKNNNLTLVSAGTTVFQGLSDQGLPVEVRNDLTAAVVADGEYGRVFIRTDNGTTLRTWQFDVNGKLTLPASGDVVDSTSVSQLARRVEDSWTVTNGTSTYSFTIPMDGTYTMWVKGNIPNGIITWNATLSISNTNVPAIGTQYAWNYTGGGSPILLTAIPNQIRGSAGTISTDNTYAGTTSNRFDFEIANTSGSAQTVYYGYTKV
jgi:hypothetical protein